MSKYLVINADDFGASGGLNRGIVDSHRHGVVTSTSLMVTGRAVHEAVAMSRDYPNLSIGLHWDVWGELERDFDLTNLAAVRDECQRQVETFEQRLGRLPTHIDSHFHLHRRPELLPFFQNLAGELGVPLRGEQSVHFIGGFYAQWEWQVTNLAYISVPTLQRILRDEVSDGWTELACHPGYASPDFSSVYLQEREEEIRTLTDPRIRQTIAELDIRLVNYSLHNTL
ncbi:MAG: ChbG/HpnK family deacetylase [Candidatus Tectomicrobia bacterium]|uniref:ChbG/HpnK family deacetylase n=1 Tax=Tectimicrobiota bacterium TaxID=2528274 RepID=A0A937W347_UNCTE|nr:ChbG/HpnK family deacetylase [Candidatus Tectomicrobia bacterium]